MNDPFTINIYATQGNPEGIRLIRRLSSTGVFFVCPRDSWSDITKRTELNSAGVYILKGYQNDDDKPTIYIGQADNVKDRISNHYRNKDFWDIVIIFVAPDNLNSAHSKYLEYELILKAQETQRCILDNGNNPNQPNISESEIPFLKTFLKEIYQTLPLADVKVFEESKKIIPKDNIQKTGSGKDTIIIPARDGGFEDTFLKQDCWHAIRISQSMLDKLRYIAVYRVAPRSQITHYAEIKHIEPHGNEGKYKVVFEKSATKLENPIKIKNRSQALQGSRYTHFKKLMNAKYIDEL